MSLDNFTNQFDYYQKKLTYEIDSSDLYAELQQTNMLIIVDGRSKDAFTREHITNAINLPHRDINLDSTKNLAKNKVYVCYCDGIGCNASTKTAIKLLGLGFQVKELIGGLDWWKRDGYKTDGDVGQDGLQANCGC